MKVQVQVQVQVGRGGAVQVVGAGRDVAQVVSPPNLWVVWGSCKTCRSMCTEWT
jgi:hypothetical protein